MHRKINLFFIICIFLQGCAQIDNYLLGKDNTPIAKELKPINNNAGLVKKWSSPPAKKKLSSYNKIQPQVSGDTIFNAHADGLIQAVNRINGNLIWRVKIPNGLVSGPTIKSGLIAVSTDSASVILLAEKNGQILWQQKVSGDVLAKPLIVSNKVIVKTIDGNLYAFDAKLGKKIWVIAHGSPSLILQASSSPVAIDNNTILAGFADGKLSAIELQTGRIIWERSLAYPTGVSDVERLIDISADPIINGEEAYIASYQGYIAAISLKNGEFIWRKPASVYKNMVFLQNKLYFVDSKDVVWAISSKNGQVQWKQLALKARGLTEPTILNNKIVVGDKSGFLHVLSTKNGNFLARIYNEQPINVAYAAKNSIYIMAANGQLSYFATG